MVSLIAASLAIITVDYRAGDEGPLADAGRAVHGAIAPLQEAVSSVVQPVTDFFSSLAELPSLSDRNDTLERELEDLRTAQQLNGELQQQVESLERVLGLQTTMSHTVAARVIASGVSNFEWTITIDAGSNDGIDENMPVVTGDESGPRLVGRVVSVTPDSSVVQLLIDRDFVVPGKLTTSQEAGTVEGRGAEELRLDAEQRDRGEDGRLQQQGRHDHGDEDDRSPHVDPSPSRSRTITNTYCSVEKSTAGRTVTNESTPSGSLNARDTVPIRIPGG